ncbi:MAG TPA: hydrogenase maturation nickel metallochaperone HypA [Candidatus Sulfotelmatobacter sp.]|nr:hydrogenase maturation nickel metallochaperone HypA [Candidatus Sulfotelmatobacter sp.]
MLDGSVTLLSSPDSEAWPVLVDRSEQAERGGRMHELSIAMGIVEAAADEAQRRGVRVSAVHLRLGALSGVVKDALLFSYEVACQETPLQGSQLIVEDMPVVVFCPRCKDQRQLASLQSFACPACGTPTMDIRQGKELEVFALEVEE